MTFLPEFLPAHPLAPEGFPDRRGQTPRTWTGKLASRRARKESETRRKLGLYGH